METAKTLNEFLLRCNDDGTLKGAHAVYLYRTFDGEKLVSAAMGSPVPLSQVDGPDLAKIAGVIGEATTAALVAKEEAEKRAADYAAELTAYRLAESVPAEA